MNQPAATANRHAKGTLLEKHDEKIVLALPGTDYQLHLAVYKPLDAELGKKITGTIRGQARRVDVTDTGGRYIEPVYGRPVRVQGAITAIDTAERSITIDCTVPMVFTLPPTQRPDEFNPGDFVTFAVMPGASFTPAG